MPAVPNIDFGIVDVRDVADLHVRAMTNPKAAGERFLAISGSIVSYHDIAMMMKKNLSPKDAAKVPTRVMPDWLIRTLAIVNARARLITPLMNKFKEASNQKARTLLGWTPRSNEEAIMSAVNSLIANGALETSSAKV